MATTPIGFSLVVLRNVPLFSGLDDPELEKLSRVSGRKRVERGAFVVRSGERTDSLYVLLAGRAKVTNTDEDGREEVNIAGQEVETGDYRCKPHQVNRAQCVKPSRLHYTLP